MIPAAFFSPTQPSFVGAPLLQMLTTFSALLVVLLALEWLWRTLWAMRESGSAIGSPSAAMRAMVGLLLVAALLRIGPDAILYASWPDLSPRWRYGIALWDKRLDAVAFAPFSLAWLVSYLGGPMVYYQLARLPLPLHLWPTWEQMKRPLKIGVGALALAFAFTYLR
jgi:hypothetical protein